MKRLIPLFFVFFSLSVFAQDYNPDRYRASIFPETLALEDVKYGEAPQWVWPYWNIDLNLNVYMPDGDENPKRPLIIFAHAGGFINGSKDVDNMVAICDTFARKGYVTATIDYRKGMDPFDTESAERAVYRAVQDGKAAVRYFKENAALYDIDTNNIFFGGMSAGGFISLHVAYMDKEAERPESTYGGGLVNDLECLDCAGNDYDHSSDVKAILDFWGGVADTMLLEEGDIPMMIMHGENDEVVPYEYGHPFGLFTLPESYGGLPLSERADNVGIEYEMFTSEGTLHMLDGSDNGTFTEPPNSFWSDTLLPESERFLFELIKPNTERISEENQLICVGTSVMLEVTQEAASSHFIWSYDEEVDPAEDENDSHVFLNFPVGGVYEVSVVEFNEILAASDTITFIIEVAEEVISDFSFTADLNTVDFTNESSGGDMYLWNFGDGNTSDESDPTHTYEENGTYEVYLVVTNELGCPDTLFTTVLIEGLGMDEWDELDVQIYPNPFSDQFTVVFNHGVVTKLEVLDLSGRMIWQENGAVSNATFTVETTTWSQGAYLLRLTNDVGASATYRLIK